MAGGGAGGQIWGGGGAGGLLTASGITFEGGVTYTVTVGAGGAGQAFTGNNNSLASNREVQV